MSQWREDRWKAASEWLVKRLSNGPVELATVERDATAIGITHTTLAKAAELMDVVSEQVEARPTTWRLSDEMMEALDAG